MRLRATPHNLASELALEIYAKVLDAVRADTLVRKTLDRVGDALFVQGSHVDLTHFDRIWIAGVGKASIEMAKAATEIVGDRLAGGLVITKRGQAEPVEGLEVLEASHPVLDESSIHAGERMAQFAEGLEERDLVIFVLSGGASAMMEYPREGIKLEDLQKTTEIMLGSGLDIREMNAIRSRLSRIKAGGLAKNFEPATVIALVLSDVVGNDLQAVGSGPLLERKESDLRTPPSVKAKFPEPVQVALEGYIPRLPLSQHVEHFVIGGISLAVYAASQAAISVGLRPLPYADPLKGDSRIMASKICSYAKRVDVGDSCLIFGGETTVNVKGKGLGGRCQEMTLVAARTISGLKDTCFLACGTDGADGPTDAAGGFVDPESIARAKKAGYHRGISLADNDSYHYLESCGGLIFTGPTGSNVNDLVLVVQAAR